MSRRTPEEVKNFLAEYIPGHHDEETLQELAERFPYYLMTESQLRSWKKNHHIKNGLVYHGGGGNQFPKEYLRFVQENAAGISNKELLEKFTERFGPVLTLRQLKTFKKNHHIDSGLTGQVVKGQVSWNKGKKWDDFMSKESQERSRTRQYGKGHRPHNAVPIGTEIIDADGYHKRKVGEPNKWKFMHRMIYEENYGPVPKNSCVIFLDGNKDNLDPENLKTIPRSTLVRLNQNKLIFEDGNLTESAIAMTELNKKIIEMKKGRKKR